MAARKFIDYVKVEILAKAKKKYPVAVKPGGDYEGSASLLEYVIQFVGEANPNTEVAKRLMAGFIVLGLDTTADPIRNWQNTLGEWNKHFPRITPKEKVKVIVLQEAL